MSAKKSTARASIYKIKVARGPLSDREKRIERSANQMFGDAVQRELALLARKKIATVVMIDGKLVRGIPRKVNGRYVVKP